MNILQSLTELYNSEDTDSIYKELSRKILENLDDMKNITIYDVAEMTNSSRTSVWRLVQKLGYTSFSDFKYAIRSASSQYTYYNRMIEPRRNPSASAIISDVAKQISTAGKVYKGYLTEELLDELVDEIQGAVRIHFYLPFRTSFVYSFQQNLWKGGKYTEYACMIPEMIKAADYLDGNSIVFINPLEFTESQDMSGVVQLIEEKNARIWLFGDISSRYANHADRVLLTADAEPASWIIVFECLLLSLSEQYRSKYIDNHSSFFHDRNQKINSRLQNHIRKII